MSPTLAAMEREENYYLSVELREARAEIKRLRFVLEKIAALSPGHDGPCTELASESLLAPCP